MVACFVISAIVSFGFAVVQCFPLKAMNLLMHTSELDNGHFWIAAEPPGYVVVLATVALALFGGGYLWLILFMNFFRHRVVVNVETATCKQTSQRRASLDLQPIAKRRLKLSAQNRVLTLVVPSTTDTQEALHQEQNQHKPCAWLDLDNIKEFTSISGAYHHYYVCLLYPVRA